VVRRLGRELGRTGVDGLVDRPHACGHPGGAHLGLAEAADAGDLGVGEAMPLGEPQGVGVELVRLADGGGDLVDEEELVDEPRVDPRRVEDLLRGGAGADREHHLLEPAVVRDLHLLEEARLGLDTLAGARYSTSGREVERRGLVLQAPQRLVERLGEVAADRHRLADRLHVRGQRRVGGWELLEREPRHLHDDVVERRLEGRRGLLRDVVGDLVERVADGDLGGDLRDRVAGRLRGER